MDIINITFDRDEILRYLKSWGYEIRMKTIRQSYPVYHNDVEYEDVKRQAVYKNGKMAARLTQHDDPVETVFEREFRKRLFNKLT